MPGSIGHSPSHALQRDCPLSEGGQGSAEFYTFYTQKWRGARLPLQGKALLSLGRLLRRFLPLKYRYPPGEACRRPYTL